MALAATVSAAPAPQNTYRTLGELINGFTWSAEAVSDNEADNWIKDAASIGQSGLRYWDDLDLTDVTAAFKELNTGVKAALAGTTPETIDIAADDQKWKDSRADSPLQWSPNEAGVFAWNPKISTFDDLIALFLVAGAPAETEIGLGFDEIDISPLPRRDGQGNSMAGATLRGMVDPSIGAIDNTRADALLLR